eukprot:2930520-Ditylum_brightwellii.AAC.2
MRYTARAYSFDFGWFAVGDSSYVVYGGAEAVFVDEDAFNREDDDVWCRIVVVGVRKFGCTNAWTRTLDDDDDDDLDSDKKVERNMMVNDNVLVDDANIILSRIFVNTP